MSTKENDINKLLEILSCSDSIDDLIKNIYPFIKNPIALTDINYYLISYFPQLLTIDETFNCAISRGYWSLEFISQVTKQLDNEKPYSIVKVNNNRRIMFPLSYNNIKLGYMAILEQDTNLDNIDLNFVYTISKLIARELFILRPHQNTMDSQIFLFDLISDTYTNRNLFLQNLKKTKIDYLKAHTSILISLKYFTLGKNKDSKFYNDLYEIINKNAILTTKDNYLYLLFDKEINQNLFIEFNNLFAKYHLFGIYSSKIIDLYKLNVIYNILTKILNFIDNGKIEYKLYNEEDFKNILYLINTPDKDILINYVNEEILILYNYDKENKTNYLETLYFYLVNQKSINEAGKQLFLHRNTIIYRIDKIKEIINYNLDDNLKNISLINSINVLNFIYHDK